MANRTHNFKATIGVKTLASTLVLTSALASNGAFAQTAEDDNALIEEVIVSGTRTSLKNAQDIKRDSATFVDAISASDIGALPDRSVLEALQRLPGVSVERFAASDDPDRFSAEGSGAVVRGMTATRTEFNGRDSFTANSGRGLSFQDVSPELMGSVKLYKNQTADMIEGGIGGTVSLHTRLPFDSDGQVAAFSGDYTYFDLSQKSAPNMSGLYSNRWDTEAGEFGLLVGLARGQQKSQSDGIQSEYYNSNDNTDGTFDSPLDAVRYPSGSNISSKYDERIRKGTSAALQWENPDDSVLATFGFMRSDSSLTWTERKIHIGNYDDRGGRTTRPMEGTNFTFDDSGTFVSGILGHSNDSWRSETLTNGSYDGLRVPTGPDGRPYNESVCFDLDSPDEGDMPSPSCDARSLTWGKNGGTGSRWQTQNSKVDDWSFNVRYIPSEQWEFIADVQYIDAQTSNTDVTMNLGFWALDYFNTDNSGTPQMGLINPWEAVRQTTVDYLTAEESVAATHEPAAVPITRSSEDYFASNSSYWWNDAMDHYERSEGEEISSRLDGTYFFEGSFFDSVKMGVRYAKREQTVRSVSYATWGAISGMRGKGSDEDEGYHAAWADMVMQNRTEQVDWSDFNRGNGSFMGNSTVQDGTVTGLRNDNQYLFVHPKVSLLKEYQQWDSIIGGAVYEGGNDPWEPVYERDIDGDGIPDTQGYFLPNDITDIQEINTAGYVMLNFGSDDFMFRFDGNIGVRYYQIDLESAGYVRFPDLVSRNTDPTKPEDYLTDVNNFLSPAETGFGNAATALLVAENSYSHILPSFNLKVEFTDDLIGRFAVSKAVAAPDIGDLRSYMTINAVLEETVYGEETDPNDTLVIREIESAGVRNWRGNAGNPYLVPMESIQYDASVEWYFADVGSLSASVFYKDLKNFFIDGAFPRVVTNTTTDVTQSVDVSGKVNGGDGELLGFELAYQQYFDMLPEPFDGLGMQFNYTYIDAEGVPNPALEDNSDRRSEDVTASLPLQSQSKDTANLAFMYDTDNWEFRTAYNWRSRYLVTARDGANLPYPPTWAAASGYLDASLFYSLNDNVKIGLQGSNLSNTIGKTEFQNVEGEELNGRSWFTNDRRYALVLRATY
ncbi:TonB-dependent receptor [Teredinibacter haidensis]|uniref:TonB-dependent receptor n=1 Tax=Teredinibacter haidensis TaxID=2731755 RepID=UPI0009489EEA|nr:TonB-dependent receptor [Teredinibacter haidensis]